MMEWIRCADGLPKMHDAGILNKIGVKERSDKCIITIRVGDDKVVDNDAELRDGAWHSSFLRFLGSGKRDFEVTAWMPLPAPFEEGGDDEGSDRKA